MNISQNPNRADFKLVFVTNLVNHHQLPVADELYKHLGANYTYVATMALPESMKKIGYKDVERPYVCNLTDLEDTTQIQKEIDEADVVILGGVDGRYVKNRLRNNRLTIHYSERLLKRPLRLLSPYHWYKTLMTHTVWNGKNSCLLCASAFTPSDMKIYGAHINRCFKWGYFTKVEELDIEEVLQRRDKGKAQLMWCARFLKWKHPELPIRMAARLKERGYNFHLNIYGSGEEFSKSQQLANKLQLHDVLTFCGNLPNGQILEKMRESHIFLFTSDRNEGWGAVLNEAMSNGCAVVASDKIGAVPYLINSTNGCVFKSENLNSLTSKVEFLINNKEEREQMSREAYRTMRDVWSPENAANNLIELINNLLLGNKEATVSEGPCSKAPYL